MWKNMIFSSRKFKRGLQDYIGKWKRPSEQVAWGEANISITPTAIYLISSKQCKKVISQTGKFIFFMILSQGEQKVITIAMDSTQGLSTQQKQVDKLVEEYKFIFSSPTGVPLHCQVKHSINLTLDASLPNGLVYRHSLMENEEIKHQIQ
jgi:hypothetical protein